MHREQIKALALANGFKLKPQPDGTEDLNPYVYEFAAALTEHMQQQNDYLSALASGQPLYGIEEKIRDLMARNKALREEVEHLTDTNKQFGKIIHNQVVANQAAWIEWQRGKGAEAAMAWVHNGLWGPGQIPDESEPWANDPQAYYDANKADPFPACYCGRPSNQLWMGHGACCDEHMKEIQRKEQAKQVQVAREAIENRTTDPVAIGQKLRQARLSLGLTQGEMARLFDIPVSRWSAVESGKGGAAMKTPPIKTCDHCQQTGIMPTFRDGETVCTDCMSKSADMTRGKYWALQAEVDRLRDINSRLRSLEAQNQGEINTLEARAIMAEQERDQFRDRLAHTQKFLASGIHYTYQQLADHDANVIERELSALADEFACFPERQLGGYWASVETRNFGHNRAKQLRQQTKSLAEEMGEDFARECAGTRASADTLAERQRQISEEGWSPERDDSYEGRQLSWAAACYAMLSDAHPNTGEPPNAWPWAEEWWKPTDYRSNLIKATALLLAEIERLDRAAAGDVGND